MPSVLLKFIVGRKASGRRGMISCRSFLRQRRPFMAVTYRVTMYDAWNQVCFIVNETITGKLLFAFLILAPLTGLLFGYHTASVHHAALHHAASLNRTASNAKAMHLLVGVFLLVLVGTYVLLSFGVLLGLYLGTLMAPSNTVTIDSKFCHLKTVMGGKTRWRQFSCVVEEADYYHFVGWARLVNIPKRAFDSREEGQHFFRTALSYWRQAKGLPPDPVPDFTGVWPPAPSVANPQESGSRP